MTTHTPSWNAAFQSKTLIQSRLKLTPRKFDSNSITPTINLKPWKLDFLSNPAWRKCYTCLRASWRPPTLPTRSSCRHCQLQTLTSYHKVEQINGSELSTYWPTRLLGAAVHMLPEYSMPYELNNSLFVTPFKQREETINKLRFEFSTI